MSTYGGFNYTGFRGVNLRNTAAIRMEMDGGFAATVAIPASPDASRAYRFPDKDGTFPIMGTFKVQLPAIATTYYSTIATVTGIRAEDALIVFPNKGVTGGYNFATTSIILIGADPGNGQITLFFQNSGNSTGYIDRVYSYVAAR